MKGVKMIVICNDFSPFPGGRYIKEGKYSGQEFRDTILISEYEKAEKNGEKLVINFDGCFGFGTSFLEEAFGGLVREYKKRGVFNKIDIISTEDETIPEKLEKYIKSAEAKLKW